MPPAERQGWAAALAPLLRGLVSTDRRQVGHFTDDEVVVLDFLAPAEHPRLAALGTSCPDHFLRTKVRPLLLDTPAGAPLEQVAERLRELHATYPDGYRPRAGHRGRLHDTASAVVAVPAEDAQFAYISCGTWSLVGVELAAPVLTGTSRRANFTNEAGVDGTVRYLRDVMGLRLPQECRRVWSQRGEPADPATLLEAAAAARTGLNARSGRSPLEPPLGSAVRRPAARGQPAPPRANVQVIPASVTSKVSSRQA